MITINSKAFAFLLALHDIYVSYFIIELRHFLAEDMADIASNGFIYYECIVYLAEWTVFYHLPL